MNQSKKLIEIRNEILREMYREAEPSFNFDRVLENPDKVDDDFYTNHYLPEEKSREILNKHFDKNDLSRSEKRTLRIETILNLGPTNSQELVQEN